MRSPAIIAAQHATEVASTMLLHDDEGHFGDEPVVEKLAEAIVHAVDLHMAGVESCDHDYRAALNKLRSEAVTFIRDWAG